MDYKSKLRNRLRDVIKTDATTVDLEEFLATHVPFKNLKYFKTGLESTSGKSMNEEDFFNEVIDINDDNHNMLIVQGGNGSGKSHFIKWIKNKLELKNIQSSEIVVLIERSNNTLQDTIKQLLKNEEISKFLTEEEKIKLQNSNNEISNEKFLSMLNYNFVVEVECEEEETNLSSMDRKRLVEFLKDSIVQQEILLSNNGPIKRISSKIKSDNYNENNENNFNFNEEDFNVNIDLAIKIRNEGGSRRALKFAEDLKDNNKDIRSRVVNYLNKKVEKVIQNSVKLNSKDLNIMLEKIRIKLKESGKTLTLLIEDITAFTGIDKGLVESLIVENTEKNKMCKLVSVIGITNSYYSNNFPDNLKERVTGRVLIDTDSLFVSEDDRLELAARYINALNVEKVDLKKWINKNAIDEELPLAPKRDEWASYFDGKRNITIYPFNRQALENLYKEMDVDSPRIFIKNIILPMIDLFVNSTVFPVTLEEFESDLKIPKFTNEMINRNIDSVINDEYQASRTKAFLRIWGNGTIAYSVDNGKKMIAGIDEKAFDEFDIVKVEGNEVKNKNEIKHENIKKEVVIASENQSLTVDKEIIIEKKDYPKEGKAILFKKNTEKISIENELREWIVNRKKIKSHAKIRNFIVMFIKEFIDWDMEEIPSSIYKSVLNRININIEDQTSEIPNNTFIIEKNEENYYFLLALINYNFIGSKKWNYEGAQNDIVICSSWIEKNKDKIINFIFNKNYDSYIYNILAERQIKIISGNISKCSDVKDIYIEIMRELKEINYNDLRKILGDSRYYNIYMNELSLEKCNENYETIIQRFNCTLGDKISNILYIDATEIINKIEYLMKNNWQVEEQDSNSIKSLRDIELKSYEFCKSIINNIFDEEVDNNINTILKNIEKIKYTLNDNTIRTINELFGVLKNHNIIYNQKMYSDFKHKFIDETKYKNKIKQASNLNEETYIEKIYQLRMGIGEEIVDYESIISSIEAEVERLERLYSEKTKGINEIYENNQKILLETKNSLNNIECIVNNF